MLTATQLPLPDPSAPGGPFAALVGAALVVSMLSGFTSAWVTARMTRSQQRGERVRSDVDRAVEALAALRDGYRASALGQERDALALARLEDVLDLAAQRTTAPVVAAARRYVEVGRLYAATDPDTGVGDEQAAFDDVAAALMAERKAYS